MTDTSTLDDTKVINITHRPYNTILFNDKSHSMDEVAEQIMKAIHCDVGKAHQIMLEAHNTGRAIVITDHKERCELVAAILEEIRLGVKVEPV